MISYILFQFGISRELNFCEFCGKEELTKGKLCDSSDKEACMQESNVTLSEASSCQQAGSQALAGQPV